MEDLIAWLRACLDDDEKAAKEAGGASWTADVPNMVHVDPKAQAESKHAFGKQGYVASVERDGVRTHIARHDPAAVLADVEAKRAILSAHHHVSPSWCSTCDVPADVPNRGHGCLTIRLLASAYRHRPGWREKWEA